MVGAGAGGNVGGTAGCFLGLWLEDTHQVALVVDALNGCCSFALVKIAHEVDVVVIALQLLDELDNIGDKVSLWVRVRLVVPGEMTPLLLRGRKSAHCEGVTLTDSVRGDDSEGDAVGAHQGVRYPASHAGGVAVCFAEAYLGSAHNNLGNAAGFPQVDKSFFAIGQQSAIVLPQ